MSNIVKLQSAISKVLKREIQVQRDSRLNEDLGMSSLNLVELTVAMHSLFGTDLGRAAAKRKMDPRTVADLLALMEPLS